MLVGLTLIPCFPRSITAGATVVARSNCARSDRPWGPPGARDPGDLGGDAKRSICFLLVQGGFRIRP
jgi:hypothetical protein